MDALHARACQEVHEVNEVADLATYATAALAWVLRPVRARDATGVDAVENRERRACVREKFFRLARERREASVEADRQRASRSGCRFEHSVKLLVVQCERLLDEDAHAAFERAAREFRVRVVSRGDDY